MPRVLPALTAVLISGLVLSPVPPSVQTVFGTGVAGYSDRETTTPFGFAMGPDGALYFCEMDGQRVRRLDLATKRVTTIAGSGERGYSGDGGPAVAAALNMPHELQFDAEGDLYVADRDSHTIRRIEMKTGTISTAAGTGVAGFAGDGGSARAAQLRGPHCLLSDGAGSLLICDVGNHRIRRLDLRAGVLDTYAGTGEAKPTPDGAPVAARRSMAPARSRGRRAGTCISPCARGTRYIGSTRGARRCIGSPEPARRATPAMMARRWRRRSPGRKASRTRGWGPVHRRYREPRRSSGRFADGRDCHRSGHGPAGRRAGARSAALPAVAPARAARQCERWAVRRGQRGTPDTTASVIDQAVGGGP